MPEQRSAVCIGFAVLAMVFTTIDATASRDEEAHEFGTDPARTWYPNSAIDSTDIPNIVLRESDAPDEPLQVYPLNERTWLLFGNVAVADAYNRGWTGNAGFVVTDDGVVVIDALGTPKLGERLIATIKTVTEKPIRYLIVTHNHPDHVYGTVAFKRLGGVTIISHEGAEQYFNSGRWETSVDFRRSIIAPDMQGFEFVLPDIAIDGVEQAEFEDWKDTRLYGANQPANASFIYRELEEDLF